MGLLKHILLPLIVGVGVYIGVSKFKGQDQIDFPEDGWYGSGRYRADKTDIKPFKVSVPKEVIEDLHNRLRSSRVSHVHLEDANDNWYGFNSETLAKVKEYWLNNYDWSKQEKIINSFEQFKTEIEGLQVHFIHAKPDASYKSLPLLMAHGWPGNVFEFYKIIPILTDPKKYGINSKFAFEVIAPSIPGYGWSEQPKKKGFSQLACARVFRKLMNRLGFEKFYLQGGDWGALITSSIAKVYPENVLGLHLNSMFVSGKGSAMFIDIMATFFPKFLLSSTKLQKDHSFFGKWKILMVETGYMHIQATKPDTVGTALNDSPLGLAAYLLEKYSTWTNPEFRNLPDGGLTKKFTMDELLTMVMIYWTNGNIVSSQRFYREFFTDEKLQLSSTMYCSIPTAHASGLNELYDRTPIEVSKHYFNVTHYTEMPDTGHFAAFEKPAELAKDVFSFVKTLV